MVQLRCRFHNPRCRGTSSLDSMGGLLGICKKWQIVAVTLRKLSGRTAVSGTALSEVEWAPSRPKHLPVKCAKGSQRSQRRMRPHLANFFLYSLGDSCAFSAVKSSWRLIAAASHPMPASSPPRRLLKWIASAESLLGKLQRSSAHIRIPVSRRPP